MSRLFSYGSALVEFLFSRLGERVNCGSGVVQLGWPDIWFSVGSGVCAGVQYVVQLWLHCGSDCSGLMWCGFGAVVVQISVA